MVVGSQGWPRRFLSGLISANVKPHEHRSELVGASCLLLAIPVPLPLAYGDPLTGAWLLSVAVCSLFGDFFYLGTIWNVIDRWVAVSFTIYLTCVASQRVPALTFANLFLVAGFLAYSQSSCTPEQWRRRHSLWHAVMMCDITFFLMCIYSHGESIGGPPVEKNSMQSHHDVAVSI
mmetsp:Transcript_58417/g.135964  ORF Transcript_58417/g.135964 Transcript_58417/m.135964 type:complete len:176 (+) Transcript_58417:125-652(+)